MTIEELTEKYKEKLKDNDLFSARKVDTVNYDPHPYTVGAQHVAHASEKGGMLDKETLDEVPCAAEGCTLTYEEHKFDTVIFLSLKRNGTNTEAKKALELIKDDMIKDNIDGLVMVETEEKFRIDEK